MTASLLALSLSSSFTKVGAIVAFAGLVGIAVMSLLFFSQARELKRLREWADDAPARQAELEQRIGAAVALRIQRATAELARPVATKAPPARAVSAAPATKVAAGVPAAALLPAAPIAIGSRKAPVEIPVVAPAPVVAEPQIEAPAPEVAERVPELAAVGATARVSAAASPAAPAAAPPAVPARPAPPKPRAPEPPPAAGRSTPRRAAAPALSGGRSQPPRRAVKRPRGGPPPGPPFLREEHSPARGRLLLALAAVVVLVLLVVVFASSGGGGGKGAASTPSPPSPSPSPTAPGSEATRTTARENSAPATAPGETRVVVLNGTETGGLAHRLAGNLQQSGYTLANALNGHPPGTHATTVVEYTSGHRVDARHVAQTLGVSDVRSLDAATGALAGSATVVVVAGNDQVTAPPAGEVPPAEGTAGANG